MVNKQTFTFLISLIIAITAITMIAIGYREASAGIDGSISTEQLNSIVEEDLLRNSAFTREILKNYNEQLEKTESFTVDLARFKKRNIENFCFSFTKDDNISMTMDIIYEKGKQNKNFFYTYQPQLRRDGTTYEIRFIKLNEIEWMLSIKNNDVTFKDDEVSFSVIKCSCIYFHNISKVYNLDKLCGF